MPAVSCECNNVVVSDDQLQVMSQGTIFAESIDALTKEFESIQQDWCNARCPNLSDGKYCVLRHKPGTISELIVYQAQQLTERRLARQKVSGDPGIIQ